LRSKRWRSHLPRLSRSASWCVCGDSSSAPAVRRHQWSNPGRSRNGSLAPVRDAIVRTPAMVAARSVTAAMDVSAAIGIEVAIAAGTIRRIVPPRARMRCARMRCVTVRGAMDRGQIASLASIQRKRGRNLSRAPNRPRAIQHRAILPRPSPLLPPRLGPISPRARKVRQQTDNAVTGRNEVAAAVVVAAVAAEVVGMKVVQQLRMARVRMAVSLPPETSTASPRKPGRIPVANSAHHRRARSRNAASTCRPRLLRRSRVAKSSASLRPRPGQLRPSQAGHPKHRDRMSGRARCGLPDRPPARIRGAPTGVMNRGQDRMDPRLRGDDGRRSSFDERCDRHLLAASSSRSKPSDASVSRSSTSSNPCGPP